MNNNDKITSFIHVGLIVENLETAVSGYEALGFGPFDPVMRCGGNGEPAVMTGWGLDGKECMGDFFLCSFTKCRNFGIELELIQPGEKGPYKEWAEKVGYGLQHLAVCSDDYDNMRKKLIEMSGGEAPYIDGVWPQTNIPDNKWAYIDLRKTMGTVIELCATTTDPEEVTSVIEK